MAIRALWMDSDGEGAVEYFARDFRDLVDVLFEPGVFDGLQVVERSAGANMTVTITGPGRCAIESTYTSDMGTYLVTVPEDEEDITIGAAPGSGTRRDIVGLQVQDHSAGGPTDVRECVPVVVEGDTSGDDPTLPESFIALARVRIPSGTASITDALIDDLREPARLKYDVVADDTIDTARIEDGAVTEGKLASDSVTSAKIAAGTIATGDIGNNQVTTGKLATTEQSNGSWTVVTPASNWSTSSVPNGLSLRYKRVGNIVFVCGGLRRSGGGTATSGETIATLPAGFRPAAGASPSSAEPAGVGAGFYVASNGNVITTGSVNVGQQIEGFVFYPGD